MVRDAIVLPLMMYYIHSDLGKLREAHLKLDPVLTHSLKQIQEDMFIEHRSLRKQLQARGIKILAERHTSAGVEADYLCRGSKHRTAIHWEVVRAETLRRVGGHADMPATGGK